MCAEMICQFFELNLIITTSRTNKKVFNVFALINQLLNYIIWLKILTLEFKPVPMKNIVILNDEQLMKEIKADNKFAFDTLYRQYSKKLFQFGFSILKSTEETENLIQDVFLNLWENRQKVEKDASVKSYIFTIAYNSAISILRKKSRESQFIEYLESIQDTSMRSCDLDIEYNELSKKLEDIIKELPQRQKEVYLLHKFDGLKYYEIAERLDISVNTIENHMSRALKTIRLKLGNYTLITILFWYLFVS
jgi:RNA polymerase sigma-70 factor (family 1)